MIVFINCVHETGKHKIKLGSNKYKYKKVQIYKMIGTGDGSLGSVYRATQCIPITC